MDFSRGNLRSLVFVSHQLTRQGYSIIMKGSLIIMALFGTLSIAAECEPELENSACAS
jgi:hypothetical protein